MIPPSRDEIQGGVPPGLNESSNHQKIPKVLARSCS